MGGPVNPPDHPGYLAINFFEQGNPSQQLLDQLISLAVQAGYTVTTQTNNSALLERGY